MLLNFISSSISRQFLTEKQRDIISTYALPLSVLIFSLVSSLVFKGINVEKFEFQTNGGLERAKIETLDTKCVFICAGLGFALSILFFMDQASSIPNEKLIRIAFRISINCFFSVTKQNITTLIIHQPTNNLQKSPAYHLDLLVLAVVNGYLSLHGLPWMHAVLPQSPM